MRLITSKTNGPYTLSSPEKFVRIMKFIMFEIPLKQQLIGQTQCKFVEQSSEEIVTYMAF